MEINFICPEGSDLALLHKAYPDLYHDDTYDGSESWWIGKCGDEYYDSERDSYEYDEDGVGDFVQERDFDKEWMTREECVEFCGFAEALIPDSETMLEGNGGWAQGQLRNEDEYLKGKLRAEAILQNDKTDPPA